MYYNRIIKLEHGSMYVDCDDKVFCEIKRDWIDEEERFNDLSEAIDWYTDWCERYIVSNFE